MTLGNEKTSSVSVWEGGKLDIKLDIESISSSQILKCFSKISPNLVVLIRMFEETWNNVTIWSLNNVVNLLTSNFYFEFDLYSEFPDIIMKLGTILPQLPANLIASYYCRPKSRWSRSFFLSLTEILGLRTKCRESVNLSFELSFTNHKKFMAWPSRET